MIIGEVVTCTKWLGAGEKQKMDNERIELDYAKPTSWNDIVQLAIAHSDLDNFYFVISSQGSGRGPAGGEHAHGRGRGSGCDICRK